MAIQNPLAKSKDKAKKAVIAPSKKTMNFVHHESSFNVKKLAPIIILVVLVAAAALKFGVLDQLDRKTQKYAELSTRQAELAALQTKLAGNSKLLDDYGRYSYGWLSEEEVATVDRMEILELLDEKVMSQANIKDFAINNNAVTMNLSDTTLERASAIVNSLENSELVQSAAVYSVNTSEGNESVINMGIVLAYPTQEEAAEQ